MKTSMCWFLTIATLKPLPMGNRFGTASRRPSTPPSRSRSSVVAERRSIWGRCASWPSPRRRSPPQKTPDLPRLVVFGVEVGPLHWARVTVDGAAPVGRRAAVTTNKCHPSNRVCKLAEAFVKRVRETYCLWHCAQPPARKPVTSSTWTRALPLAAAPMRSHCHAHGNVKTC